MIEPAYGLDGTAGIGGKKQEASAHPSSSTTTTTPYELTTPDGPPRREQEEADREEEEGLADDSDDRGDSDEVEPELEDLDSLSPQDSFVSVGESSDRASSVLSEGDFSEISLLSPVQSRGGSVLSSSPSEVGSPTSDWVKCFAIVDFDITYGQKIRATVPENALSQEEDNGIRMLAMPECQSDQTGDSFYCFRRRISTQLPLYSGSALDHEYQYCYVLFRQCKSDTEKRGYFQQSLVLVSKYPLYSLYRYILTRIGGYFFSRGPAILESVYSTMVSWPPHSCDTPLELCFMGDIIRFRVPQGFKEETTGHWASNGCDRSHTYCDVFVVDKDRHHYGVLGGVAPLSVLGPTPRGPSPSPEVGLFQSIGLYRTFRPVLPLLWPLWEKVLVGEPIMIIAHEASTASSMALGLISLISPIYYAGDFRPYFSTYEEDYVHMLRCHDSSQGSALPATILGVTNPFFTKSFKHWPTVLQVPPKQSTPTTVASRPKRRPFPPLKVISVSTEVDSGLASGKTDDGVPVGLLTRKEPIIKPNIVVLAHIHRTNDANRREPKERRLTTTEMRHMNDLVLLRHFQGLTESFLKPFDKYFELRLGQQEETTVDTVSANTIFRLMSSSSKPKPQKSCRIGLYDDPEKFLSPFDEESFLSGLKKSGNVPAEFKDLNWMSLYRRFIHSPNFRPWFNSRRAACVAELRSVCRATVRTVTGESFLRSAIEDGNGYLSETEMIQLMLRVRRALDQEMQSLSPEEELCAQMRTHLEAVENALPPVVLNAVKETYGLTAK